MTLLLPARVPFTRNTLTCMDVLRYLNALPSNSVHCVITSPPYYGLRDYGVDGQIGLEDTPQAYVARMVEVFRQVHRVLRDDGVLWLNVGDSYTGSANSGGSGNRVDGGIPYRIEGLPSKTGGFPPKSRLMIPARVAIALQDDGWILRSEIVWHKPNPMPNSYTDRPTDAHEMVYLLAKQGDYWYDAEAIREPHSENNGWFRQRERGEGAGTRIHGLSHDKTATLRNDANRILNNDYTAAGRNKRTVWTIPTEASDWDYCQACGRFYMGSLRNAIEKQQIVGADGELWDVRICLCGAHDGWVGHYAMYPSALIEPMLLAGCPRQTCATCGKGWVREVERGVQMPRNRGVNEGLPKGMNGHGIRQLSGKSHASWKIAHPDIDKGFHPACDCHADATQPGLVLDPFMGSGTTALVARALGRDFIGCDVSPEYAEIVRRRLALPYTLPMLEMLS